MGILEELYQRHLQPCHARESRTPFLQSFSDSIKTRHILRALGEEQSYKYKDKMQEFFLNSFFFILTRAFLIIPDTELCIPQARSPICPLLVLLHHDMKVFQFEFVWGGEADTDMLRTWGCTHPTVFTSSCLRLEAPQHTLWESICSHCWVD